MSADKKPVVERMRIELQKQLRAERRERIATAALQALVSNPVAAGSAAYFAHQATSYADALIAELDKEAAAEIEQLRADNERLRKALRDALDGLRYWVPQTSVGAIERCKIVEKGIEALEAEP